MLRIRSLLLAIAYVLALLGVTPLFVFLEWWTQLSFGVAVLLGLLGDRRNRQLLEDRWATIVSIVVTLFCASQLSVNYFVEPVVNLLVLFQAVRLLGRKTGRHLLQIFLLSMFCLASSSLLSLSLAFFPLLIVMVFLVTIGLMLLTFHTCVPNLQLDRNGWRMVLWPACILPIGSLLLMLFFFVVLPRTQRPNWNFLNPSAPAKVSLSEEVRPGHVSSLAKTSELAFRVEMTEQDPLDLYWRTIVLNRVENGVWSRQGQAPSDWGAGRSGIEQTIFLEPKADQFLPAMDVPLDLFGYRIRSSGDRIFRVRYQINKRISYRANSLPQDILSLAEPSNESFYLQLPTVIDQRLLALAQEVRGEEASRHEIITRLKDYFRGQNLSYSSTNLPQTDTPVATFLFESRRGYCEYFASSFGLLLRLAGVPTRLVGGYLGGRYNSWGGYYLVPESAAHVWVEALLEDGRWQRIDPSRLAQNSASAVQGIQRQPLSWFDMLNDSVSHLWNRAVLNYDLQSQFEILRQTNRTLHRWSWRNLPWSLVGWVALVAGGCFGLAWWFRRHSGRERRILEQYLRVVERRFGFNPEGMGLFDIAERTGHPSCRRFAELYGGTLYRDRTLDGETIRTLTILVEELARN